MYPNQLVAEMDSQSAVSMNTHGQQQRHQLYVLQ